MAKYWMGDAPTHCDIDQTPIQTKFVDGVTSQGPWANMCLGCHRKYGKGLGMGHGQLYEKTEVEGKTRWLKMEG